MGLWSGIKYALNSTLGTGGFKPLDTLLTDWLSTNVGTRVTTSSLTGTLMQRINYIASQRAASLTGTGVTIYSGSTTSTTITRTYFKVIAKFIAPLDGIYRVTYPGANSGGKTSVGKLSREVCQWSPNSLFLVTGNEYYAYNLYSVNSNYTTGTYDPSLPRAELITLEYSQKSGSFYCKAGEPVVLAIVNLAESNYTTPSITTTAGTVTVTYQSK